MAHSASSSSTHGSSSNATNFKVYGSVFKVSSRYQFLHPLGKGSYGIVCAAKDCETGQCVAIKKVTPMAKRTVDAKHTLREVLLLQHLGKHPNVISIHNLSANVKDDELYIVMDLMDTDMHRVIQSSQPLSDSHAKHFLHQLLRGVKYLHDNGVLHRDLKPGNLLLSKTCQLKIADFGLARKIPRGFVASSSTLDRPRSAPAASKSLSAKIPDRPPMTEHVVTRWYRAPELMLQPDGLYDQNVDMWSVGCIFAEILGRKALFPGKNFLHQLTLIFDVIGAPSSEATMKIQSSQAQRFLQSLGKKPKVPFRSIFPNASESAVDLLDRMLEFDPSKRISAQEALNHPYMHEMERKHRNRSGSVELPTPMRADFSFDLKKLTKVDLRALIVKEVDKHRKSIIARPSSATSNSGESSHVREKASTIEKPRSILTPSSSSASSTPSAVPSTTGAHANRIHATIRQAQEQSQENEKITHQRQSNAVIFGSDRQRIRQVSKPPIPKQLEANVWVSNQHEHVRVVAGQATLLSDSLTSRVSPTEEEESKHTSKPEDLSPFQSRHQELDAITAKEPSSTPVTEGPKLYARTRLPARATYSRPSSALKAPRSILSATISDTSSVASPSASDAIATAILLSKKSNALIASLAVSAKTPFAASISSTFRHSQAWKTDQSTNPESSSSSLSDSPYSPPRHDEAGCTNISRSNRPGSAFLTKKVKKKTIDERPSTSSTVGRPRRISSAGPARSKPRPVTTSGSFTARNSAANSTYVGSTNSLIRAQRSNTGQSLAESANRMYATMSQNEQQYSVDSREERAGSQLQHQRSTSQLPGGDKRQSSKRLTVPKSPKFSVMSWQKKREGRVGK